MITQGTFAFLPPLTDDEIRAQLRYAIENKWAVSIEFTDDPHPRNLFWDLWGLPMFDLADPEAVMMEIHACRSALPSHYIKVNAFDNHKSRETRVLSFTVSQPQDPGFRIERQHGPGRTNRYTLHPYAAELPHGDRYPAR